MSSAKNTFFVSVLGLITLALLALSVFHYILKPGFDNTAPDGYEPARILNAHACKKNGCGDEVIVVHGYFTKATPHILKQHLDSITNPLWKDVPICFSSPGGIGDSAIRVGNIIADRKLNTCMAMRYKTMDGPLIKSPVCGSSCPYALLAGQDRISFGSGFRLSVHAGVLEARIAGIPVFDVELNADKQTFIKAIQSSIASYSDRNNGRLIDPRNNSFIDYSFSVPNNGFKDISERDSFDRFGVFTIKK